MFDSPKRKRIAALGLLIIADLLFFSFVNPNDTLAIILVGGYVLLMLTVFAILNLFLVFVDRIVPFSNRVKRRALWIVTGLIGLLVAMQSIGQLTVRDVLAMLPLLIVGVFYFSYIGKQQPK